MLQGIFYVLFSRLHTSLFYSYTLQVLLAMVQASKTNTKPIITIPVAKPVAKPVTERTFPITLSIQ